MRAAWLLVGAALAIFTPVMGTPCECTGAVYGDATVVGVNGLTADVLNPPTAFSATGGTTVTLQWTASVDAYAVGYRVYRATASGGPYAAIMDVVPGSATSYVDMPVLGTYYYRLRAFKGNWESVDSSTTASCIAVVLAFVCS